MAAIPLAQLFPSAPHWAADVLVFAEKTNRDPLHCADAAKWLLPHESAMCQSWRSPERRSHWYAGRRVLRQALCHATGCRPTEVHLDSRESGSPIGVVDGMQTELTLTHSGEWALGACVPSGTLLALDYEVGAASRLHLAQKVCGPYERAQMGIDLQTGEGAQNFGIVWTAKEALLKAYRVGLVADLAGFGVTKKHPDGTLTIEVFNKLHKLIPTELPDNFWAATTVYDGHPLSVAGVPVT